MPSLDRHTRTPDPEAHARLAFRADCPLCRRLRLRGTLPEPEVIPRRAKAGLAAGLIAASAIPPTASFAQVPAGHGGGAPKEVLPPGGVGDGERKGGPVSPPPAAVERPDGDAPEAPPPVSRGHNAEPPPPPPQDSPPDAPQPEAPETGSPAAAPEHREEPPPAPTGEDARPPSPRAPERASARSQHPAPSQEPVAERAPHQDGQATSRPQAKDQASQTRPAGVADDRQAAGEHRHDRVADPSPEAAPTTNGGRSGREGTYEVRSGQSLWLIAEQHLDDNATDADIAEEVSRLWNLNADRIGTGDPDLILPGQTLRL